jgi:subtilase family serine protease
VAGVTLTIPADTLAGTYYLFAVADVAAVEPESVESNNQLARVVRIGPDLVSSSLSVPSKGGAGVAMAVTHTTKNQGGGPSPASAVTFYLSLTAVLDAEDDVLSAGHPVPALLPNETYTLSTSLTVPATTATGAYYVIAVIDPDGRIAETSDRNNTRAAATRIGPDLRVSSLSKTPSTVAAGATVAVTDTVLNQGGGASAAPATTGFYLSTNSSWTPDDVMLGGRPIPALAAGQSSKITTTITIPPGTAAGTYYLLAVADPADALAETFETNNVTASMIFVTIGP